MRTRDWSEEAPASPAGRFGPTTAPPRFIGDAPVFRRAIRHLSSLATSPATLLLTGETGTGKELVARAIHSLGPRAAGSFVAVNCGALPDSLLEDELFGHERGAFTDARTSRAGLLSQAHGGTLMLDEIDSLTPRAQVALLRVLQDNAFRPLGAGGERRVDVRFIAASNGDLAARVRDGGFRADLFFRLCVLTLRLPPLRERRCDIMPLAEHFLSVYAPPERPLPVLTPAAVASLHAHDWPGNVRELENAIIRALFRHEGSAMDEADLGLHEFVGVGRTARSTANDSGVEPEPSLLSDAAVSRTLRQAKHEVVDRFERAYLARVLAEHGGNITRASRAAGKERRDFGRLLKKHRLDRHDFVAPERSSDRPR